MPFGVPAGTGGSEPDDRRWGSAMTDATAKFFEELGRRGHEPLLGRIKGTIRFDLEHDKGIEHRYVAIDKGDVKVSHKHAKADTIVRVDRELFDGMVRGRVNAMAAMLRGVISGDGDLEILMAFQRLFPGPPASRTRRPATAGRRAS
jgi:putative sterol carrier protein